MATIELARLIEDMSIYPRHQIDDQHVAQMVEALNAGHQLPPIIADKKTLRVIDGWHRCRAYRRKLGTEAVVDVDLRSYRDEKEMLLAAVDFNATHGRRLDSIDRTRIAIMLRDLGVQTAKIAVVLRITEAKVEKIRVKIATAPRESMETITGTRTVALKRPVQHMAGMKLTNEQVKVHDGLPGTSFLLVSRQLRTALQAEMVNLHDEKLMIELRSLRDVLVSVIK